MFEKLLVPATWVATAGYAVTGALKRWTTSGRRSRPRWTT